MAVNPAKPAVPLGWPLLPTPDATGSLHWPDLDSSVRQTIRALLVTEPGERLLFPRLGAGLQGFVHHPNSTLTRRRMRDRIGEVLAVHEPRIRLTDLRVEPDGNDLSQVNVVIAYTLRATGQTDALQLTLELGG